MRWGLPVTVAVSAVLWAQAWAGGDWATNAPALIVVAGCAFVGGFGARLRWVVLLGVGCAALLAAADQASDTGRFSPANDGLFYAVVVLGPGLSGWLVGSSRRQVRALDQRRVQLSRRRTLIAAAAAADERERIGAQVDHVLAGRLTRIVADVEQMTEDDKAITRLARVEADARAGLEDLRGVLDDLRASPDLIVDERVCAVPDTGLAHPESRTMPRRRVPVDVLLALALVPLAVETVGGLTPAAVALDVICVAAQGAALILTRRRPLLGVVALLVSAGVMSGLVVPVSSTVSWFLPGLLAAFLVGLGAERRVAAVGLALLLAGAGALSLFTPAWTTHDVGALVGGPVMGLLAAGAGRLVRHHRSRADELRRIADELERTSRAEADLAAAQQRATSARELHDLGAHALTVVCLHAGAAQTWWFKDRTVARQAVEAIQDMSRGLLAGLGRTFTAPRSTSDPPSVESLVAVIQALGVEVELTTSGPRSALPDEVAQVVYRIVQEALTNAAKHSGRTTVRVDLDVDHDAVHIRVADIGRVARDSPLLVPITGSGLGLRGMRERVAALHGELSAGPSGRGFEVRAWLPARVLVSHPGTSR